MGRRWRAGLGLSRPGPIFCMMGRRPAWPINFSGNGPRPGPARRIFKISRPGKVSARPGPSHGSEAHETRAVHSPARQLRGPAHVLSRTKRCMCIRSRDFFYVNCWFFGVFFFRLDSVGQLLSAHETHITSTHQHNSAPPTTRSDGFLCTTASSCW